MADTTLMVLVPTWQDIYNRLESPHLPWGKVYGVPRGGAILAGLLYNRRQIVDTPEQADWILDDLVDSGRTRERYKKYAKPFFTLYDKQTDPALKGKWIVFPYEGDGGQDIQDTVVRQLEFIGEDPTREGLRATPERVVRSWATLFGGYHKNPQDMLRTFTEGACDEMVVLRPVDFYSTCEHHLMPFFGTVAIGYVPKGRVVGVSKLARLVEIFSRRLQIQERMTAQIAQALTDTLEPMGVMVVVKARHLCMAARGVQKPNAEMVTSAVRGIFQSDQRTRQEFLEFIK